MKLKTVMATGIVVGLLTMALVGAGVAAGAKPSAAPTPDPRIEQWQAKAGMRFAAAQEPTKVSAEEAEEKALAAVGPLLERQPTNVDVHLVRYSHDKIGPDGQQIAQNRLVWKVTLHGTLTQRLGGKVSHDGTKMTSPADPTVLDRSLTWVLIDANTGETVASYSAGPRK